MAMRLFPEPVGVEIIRCSPLTTPRRASAWCGYISLPVDSTQRAKASYIASGGGFKPYSSSSSSRARLSGGAKFSAGGEFDSVCIGINNSGIAEEKGSRDCERRE